MPATTATCTRAIAAAISAPAPAVHPQACCEPLAALRAAAHHVHRHGAVLLRQRLPAAAGHLTAERWPGCGPPQALLRGYVKPRRPHCAAVEPSAGGGAARVGGLARERAPLLRRCSEHPARQLAAPGGHAHPLVAGERSGMQRREGGRDGVTAAREVGAVLHETRHARRGWRRRNCRGLRPRVEVGEEHEACPGPEHAEGRDQPGRAVSGFAAMQQLRRVPVDRGTGRQEAGGNLRVLGSSGVASAKRAQQADVRQVGSPAHACRARQTTPWQTSAPRTRRRRQHRSQWTALALRAPLAFLASFCAAPRHRTWQHRSSHWCPRAARQHKSAAIAGSWEGPSYRATAHASDCAPRTQQLRMSRAPGWALPTRSWAAAWPSSTSGIPRSSTWTARASRAMARPAGRTAAAHARRARALNRRTSGILRLRAFQSCTQGLGAGEAGCTTEASFPH